MTLFALLPHFLVHLRVRSGHDLAVSSCLLLPSGPAPISTVDVPWLTERVHESVDWCNEGTSPENSGECMF